MNPVALIWHRRDLRIDDNPAIDAALAEGFDPVGVFIFDRRILSTLAPSDRRVEFIHRSVQELAASYARAGRPFFAIAGAAAESVAHLAQQVGAQAVFAGRDYEPSSIERDEQAQALLQAQGARLALLKDHVIFEAHDIRTQAGQAYSVFTPYKAAWLRALSLSAPSVSPTAARLAALGHPPMAPSELPSLPSLGFEGADLDELDIEPGESGAAQTLARFGAKVDRYATEREFPALDGSSRLGPHLRFGTCSIRQAVCWARAHGGEGAQTWISELVWREFCSMLLQERPDLAQGASYQRKCDRLAWSNDPAKLEAWKAGRTGSPLVDAAMRELARTGHMHNRCRMVAASYLCKDLDCDWRLGEAHFASLLLDFELANNNGGWQWCASTGCDAQPYFRIFNPASQSRRFDPQGTYVKRWVPELANCPASAIHEPHLAKPAVLANAGIVLDTTYPRPLVERSAARAACLAKHKAL